MRVLHPFFIFILLLPSVIFAGENTYPKLSWEFRTPESLELDERLLKQVANRIGGHGVIIKDGYLTMSWGNPMLRFDWGSALKPVLSTMLFHAITENRLESVDTYVAPYLHLATGKQLDSKDQFITFNQLANMTSGYGLPDRPGQYWAYNDYAVSLYTIALVHGVYGSIHPNHVALHESRLGALGFQDGPIFSGRRWNIGLMTSARDAARLGWFWLNKGKWHDQQIVDKDLFEQYMSIHVPANQKRSHAQERDVDDYLKVGTIGGGANIINEGPGLYGFNWWFNGMTADKGQRMWPDAPHDIIMAMGHINKEIIALFPTQNMVVAAVGNWGDFVTPNNSSAHTINKVLHDIANAAQQ